MPATATCVTCVHFSAIAGECRKNPPVVVPRGVNGQGQLVASSIFPATKDTNWCGAHEAEPTNLEEITP